MEFDLCCRKKQTKKIIWYLELSSLGKNYGKKWKKKLSERTRERIAIKTQTVYVQLHPSHSCVCFAFFCSLIVIGIDLSL